MKIPYLIINTGRIEKMALPAKWWPGSCPNFPNETGLQA
jgi:hypothetical protein